MPDVSLIPMTARELDDFIDEEVRDLAEERVLDGTWAPCEALAQARRELRSVTSWERAAVRAEGQRLLTAIASNGQGVGWLWIKVHPDGPGSPHAFLCQMTVTRSLRHRGYGRAMLAALEALLASNGVSELRLNVCEENLPARSLYEAAGYVRTIQYATMHQMCKRLVGDAAPAARSPGARAGASRS